MRQKDCYQLGKVIKTHGLNGKVTIALDVDFSEEYQKLESVFVEQQGKLIPFFIEAIQINQRKAIVKFEDIDSLDATDLIANAKLFLPLSSLPDLKEGEYYFHDLVDCEIYESSDHLGTIKELIDLNGNQLLSVDIEGKEILIPLVEEIVVEVDISSKRVNVNLPEGLLEIYK